MTMNDSKKKALEDIVGRGEKNLAFSPFPKLF